MEDLPQLGAYLAALFGIAQGGAVNGAFFYYLRSFLPMLCIAALAATPLPTALWRALPNKGKKVLLPALLLAGLFLCTAYLVDGTYNPFLYFKF